MDISAKRRAAVRSRLIAGFPVEHARLLWLLLPLLALLGGCDAVGPMAFASAASVVTFGRAPTDVVVSLAVGKDCSVVRLARGLSYCQATEPVLPPPEYCTRSLGVVNCWDRPNPFGYYQRQVADGPWMLTDAQEQNRTARWPDH